MTLLGWLCDPLKGYNVKIYFQIGDQKVPTDIESLKFHGELQPVFVVCFLGFALNTFLFKGRVRSFEIFY